MFNISKNTIIFTIASIVIIFGFLYLVFTSSNTPTESKTYQSAKKINKNDHVKWSLDKKILLIIDFIINRVWGTNRIIHLLKTQKCCLFSH